jgi:hypothetical protein
MVVMQPIAPRELRRACPPNDNARLGEAGLELLPIPEYFWHRRERAVRALH